MDAFFRAKKSPDVIDHDTYKPSKIPEGWGEDHQPVVDGMTFYVKYLGSTLIEEKEHEQTYGDGTSSKAIQNILSMAKSAGSKLKKTALRVTPKGLCTVDLATKELMFDSSIYRISFCTTDKHYNRVFAYIARNTINETMECHAYLCTKPKIAHAVTMTVSKAFSIAHERWLENKRLRRVAKLKMDREKVIDCSKQLSPSVQVTNISNRDSTSFNFQVDTRSPEILPANPNSPEEPQSQSSDFKKNWESFEDSDEEDIDTMFSKLAENRIKQIPPITEDFRDDDLENSGQKLSSSNECYNPFNRSKSDEDLFSS